MHSAEATHVQHEYALYVFFLYTCTYCVVQNCVEWHGMAEFSEVYVN